MNKFHIKHLDTNWNVKIQLAAGFNPIDIIHIFKNGSTIHSAEQIIIFSAEKSVIDWSKFLLFKSKYAYEKDDINIPNEIKTFVDASYQRLKKLIIFS